MMLNIFARLIAYALFWSGKYREVLTVLASAIVSMLVTLIVLITRGVGSGAVHVESAQVTPQSGFISAQGTTSTAFASGGPAGTGTFTGLHLDAPPAGGHLVLAGANADEVDVGSGGNNTQFDVFGTGIVLQGNGGNTLVTNIGGQNTNIDNTGGGAVNVGAGATNVFVGQNNNTSFVNIPSGLAGGTASGLGAGAPNAITWLAPTGSGNTIDGNGCSSGLVGGSQFCDNNQVVLISPTITLGDNTNTLLNVGNVTSEPVIHVGDQATTANQTIDIGPNTVNQAGNNRVVVNAGNSGNVFVNGSSMQVSRSGTLVYEVGPNFGTFQLHQTSVACGTGGTQTVAANSFGIAVTSGTLSSNCIIDFTTNGQVGLFFLDMSGVTLGATFGVAFKNGTTTTSTFVSTSVVSGTLATVYCSGANKIAVNF